MIELRRRSRAERQAYMDGYAAGIREGAKAVQLIAETGADVAKAMQRSVEVMLELAAKLDSE